MKFHLVDRIECLQPPERIVTTKCLSAAEEYLADHFPTFPVMPGVLMLEACVQTAAWLVRLATDWQVSMVVLHRARNVRYTRFVAPGHALQVEAAAGKSADGIYGFKCTGTVDRATAVQARIDLKAFNLADAAAGGADADAEILADLRRRFELIGGPAALAGG